MLAFNPTIFEIMTLVDFPIHDSKLASDFLKSRPNKVAGQVIEAVRRGESLSNVKALLQEPCSRFYYARSGKSRNRFVLHSLVDACGAGLGEFGVQKRVLEDRFEQIHFGPITVSADSEKSKNRADCMEYLLENGFPAGDNSWRGNFLSHVISYWLSNLDNELAASLARVAFKYLRKSGVSAFRTCSSSSWFFSEKTVRELLKLADRSEYDDALDAVLRYASCSLKPGQTIEDKIGVIRTLLDAGARPSEKTTCAFVLFPSSGDCEAIIQSDVMPRLIPDDATGLLAPVNRELLDKIRQYWRAYKFGLNRYSEEFFTEFNDLYRRISLAIKGGDLTPLRAFEPCEQVKALAGMPTPAPGR